MEGSTDQVLQEGDFPPPSYGGRLTDFYISTDMKFRSGIKFFLYFLMFFSHLLAILCGGISQPFMNQSSLDVLTKVRYCHCVIVVVRPLKLCPHTTHYMALYGVSGIS